MLKIIFAPGVSILFGFGFLDFFSHVMYVVWVWFPSDGYFLRYVNFCEKIHFFPVIFLDFWNVRIEISAIILLTAMWIYVAYFEDSPMNNIRSWLKTYFPHKSVKTLKNLDHFLKKKSKIILSTNFWLFQKIYFYPLPIVKITDYPVKTYFLP